MVGEAKEAQGEYPSSPRIHTHARDLLRRFSGVLPLEDLRVADSAAAREDSAGIELSLGLSLGGCFEVDPAHRRGLVRSSSVAALPFLQRREQDPPDIPVLTRTCSLPVEAEEEQRKRKELQTLRRMEAKRKRSEKRNNSRSAGRERSVPPPEDMLVDGDGGGKDRERLGATCPLVPDGSAAARASSKAADGLRGFPPPAALQDSPGSGSSGLSEFDIKPPIRQGSSASKIGNGGEPGSQARIQPLQNLSDMKAAIGPLSPAAGNRPPGRALMEVEEPAKKEATTARGANGMKDMMDEMPCVSTRGGGPGGRRVEGFLYRYGKGEEVRIVCVCHGSFFSPAEFVKHGGGGDVAHPLRHIVVSPSPSGFL